MIRLRLGALPSEAPLERTLSWESSIGLSIAGLIQAAFEEHAWESGHNTLPAVAPKLGRAASSDGGLGAGAWASTGGLRKTAT